MTARTPTTEQRAGKERRDLSFDNQWKSANTVVNRRIRSTDRRATGHERQLVHYTAMNAMAQGLKDTERLDWLLGLMPGPIEVMLDMPLMREYTHADFRNAIDRARRGK